MTSNSTEYPDDDEFEFMALVEKYYDHELNPRYRVGCYVCALTDAELPCYETAEDVACERFFTCGRCQKRIFDRLPAEVRAQVRMCLTCFSIEPLTEMSSVVKCWACALLAD